MKRTAFVLAFTTCLSSPLLSQEVTKQQLADAASKVTTQSLRLWLSQSEYTIPKSNLPIAERSAFLEAKLADYAKMRGTYYAAKNAGEWTSIGVGAVFTGVALYAGPQAMVTVPATIVGAGLVTVVDVGNEKIQAEAERRARYYLHKNKEAMLKDAGVSTWQELRNDPSRLKLTADLVADLKLRAKDANDPQLEDLGKSILTDVVLRTEEAQLNLLGDLTESVAEIGSDLGDLIENIDENHKEVMGRLDAHEKILVSLSSDMNSLSSTVNAIDARVAEMGRNQSFISDFVLDNMSPRKKAEALANGFLAERFVCPTETPNCDAPKLKTDMIARFTAEADLQQRIGEASRVVAGLNDLSLIATNLGIESPELAKAAEIGSAAFNAVTSWFSGNPLGAVSAVSGLFGKKKDPNAAMMSFLREQFAQVNAKLDAIIENQKVILDSIVKLSEQIDRGFDHIDKRLARVQFEVERAGAGVRELIWKDWARCYSIFRVATEGISATEGPFVDRATLRFKSFADLVRVSKWRPDQFRTCLETVQTDMDKFGAPRLFVNFLDSNWVLDESSLSAVGIETKEGGWRSKLQSYRDDVFMPARMFADAHLTKERIDPAAGLALLAVAVPDASMLRRQLELRRDKPFQCSSADAGADARFMGLVCGGGSMPDLQKASDLLSRPLIADMALVVADWLRVVSQFADLYKGNGQIHESLADLLANGSGVSLGREMIEKMTLVMDVTIATYAQMYGGVPALGIIDALDAAQAAPEGTEGDGARALGAKAIEVLNGPNTYLAANVAMLLLKRGYERKFRGGAPVERIPEFTYIESYLPAEKGEQAGAFFLRGLFGDSLEFGRADNGQPTLVLAAGGATASIPLPAPGELADMRLAYPPRYFALLNKRDELADLLADYDLLATSAPAMRPEHAAMLVQQ